MSLDNRHSIALPYWARPGIVSLRTAGGDSGGTDDDGDDDEDDDEEDDEDEDEDDLAELTEDELKAELRKTRDSLSKASGSSKKKRDRIKALEAEVAAAKTGKGGKPAAKKDDEKDDAPDLDAVREAAKAEATAAANERIKKAEARGALKAAGVPAAQVADLVGMLKLDDISVGNDGEVDSDDLDEAIAALKEKWPQLFAPVKTTRKRERVAGDGDRDGKGDKAPRKPKTASELQAAAALGRVAR